MSAVRDPHVREFDEICHRLISQRKRSSDAIGRIKELDDEILSVGPWWLAHFLEYSDDEAANKALHQYLEKFWPDDAARINQMISATHWRSAGLGHERDFGSD